MIDVMGVLRSTLGGLLGGLSIVYVSGYLVLSAHYRAHNVLRVRGLFVDEYLMAGAKFIGSAVAYGFVCLLASALILLLLPRLKRLARRPSAWLHRRDVSLRATSHWLAVFGVAAACILIASWIKGSVAPDDSRYQFAFVLTVTSLLLCAWLRSTGERVPFLLVTAFTCVELTLLPAAYGAIALPPLVPFAQVIMKDPGAVAEEGGLILESEKRWVIVTSSGALRVLNADGVRAVTLQGCWQLARRTREACEGVSR